MTRQSHDYTPASLQPGFQSPQTRVESPAFFAYNRDSISRTTLRSTSTAPSVATASNTTVDGADGSKIVVGLDYGTSYTGLCRNIILGTLLALLLTFSPFLGLAWAQIQRMDNRDMHDIELRVMTEWPGQTGQKVPSLVSYSRTPNAREQYGNDIDDQSEVVSWTKLDLDPQNVTNHLKLLEDTTRGLKLVPALYRKEKPVMERDIPFHIAKDTTEIVQHFLEKVVRAWKVQIQESADGALGHIPIDIVVTHPAVSLATDLILE
jgi:molecular chaperone DnaK (HSP70)